MKSILVPINFTGASINALRTSLDIAKQTNSRVILLNNMDEESPGPTESKKSPGKPITGYWHGIHEEKYLPERLELLRGLRIQYHVPQLKIEFTVIKNLTNEGFERLVREKEIRIIVAGLEKEHSKTDFLLESIRIDEGKIDIPILFVDDYYAHLRYDKILLIDDVGSPDHELIKLVKALGSVLESKVYVTTYLASGKSLIKSWSDRGSDSSTADLRVEEAGLESGGMPLKDLDLHSLVSNLKVDLAASTKSLTENPDDLDELNIHQIHRAGSLSVPQLV